MAKAITGQLLKANGIHDIAVQAFALDMPRSTVGTMARVAVEERYDIDLLATHEPRRLDLSSVGRLVVVMTGKERKRVLATVDKMNREAVVLSVSQLVLPFLGEESPHFSWDESFRQVGDREFGKDIAYPNPEDLDECRAALIRLERFLSQGWSRAIGIARDGLHAGWPRSTVPSTCPECGSSGVAVICYGYPSLGTQAERYWYDMVGYDPPFEFGGCLIVPDQPLWACMKCGHRWAKRREPRTTSAH